MNNNLLVVGGTGFIGSSITEEALRQGYNVTVISKGHVPLEKKTKRITYISVDITNKTDLLIELDKHNFNYVINLAGYVDHNNKAETMSILRKNKGDFDALLDTFTKTD